MTDPWRRGIDPVQRVLRIVTAVVCLVVFVYLAIERSGDHDLDRLAMAGLAIACVMVLLGYERIVRLPGIGRGDDDEGGR
jgi:hypothetical protein